MKAPVEHFTYPASKEFGERGISVTTVAPDPWVTPGRLFNIMFAFEAIYFVWKGKAVFCF